ncbi:MAG: response regulator [Anaerolineales bacterium]|nr:response regulator [Anaerolineales bacterium]
MSPSASRMINLIRPVVSGLSRRVMGVIYFRFPKIRRLLLLALIGPAAVMLILPSCSSIPGQMISQSAAPQVLQPTQPPPLLTPQEIESMYSARPALAEQGQKIRFEHLTPEMGLSQSVVTDILQDQQGFLWFATQDGLNRYDGYSFKVLTRDLENPNSLSDNSIISMSLDAAGKLWLGTNTAGLNHYDPQTETFTIYRHDPADPNSLSDNSTTSVIIDRQGIIWIGTTGGGLNRLDPSTGIFTHYQFDPDDPASLSSNAVNTICEDANGAIWVGTATNGLNRLAPGASSFTRYQNDPQNPNSLSGNLIQTIYTDRQGVIWIGTINAGLNRYNPETDSFTNYLPDANDSSSLSHPWVYSLYEDRWGRFWVGTHGGGLNIMDRQAGQFTRYSMDSQDPDSLLSDSIWSIFEDSAGVMWFGTFGAGAEKYDPSKSKFMLLEVDPGDPRKISGNGVWTVYEDQDGMLWIGTENGGLNRLDPVLGEWKRYIFDPSQPGSISGNSVFDIYQDQEGILWVGSNGGLDRFDPEQELFERQQNVPAYVLTLHEDHLGILWVATAQGVAAYDRDNQTAQLYQADPEDPTSLIYNISVAIQEDRQGNVWIGSINGGVSRFDRGTGKFAHYLNNPTQPSSNSAILCIHPQEDGTLWVGTSAGLYALDPRTGQVEIYTLKNGLPNEYIYGILEDEQGAFWLSTNRGLSHFNPRTLEVKNYFRADGLQANEFNQGAFFKSQDGLLYFGGLKGVNAFYPRQLQDNPFIAPVVITDFKIFEESAPIDPDQAMDKPVGYVQEIQLAYTDDYFEFEYAALHYSSPDKIQYAYRMIGLDDDWHYVGNRRFAAYTKIQPGSYTFWVKGTNSDGIWNERGTVVNIVITPPFWGTWWFRLLAALGVLAGISGAIFLRFNAIEKQRQQLEIQVNERTHQLQEAMLELEKSKDAAEAASRAKSAFLANMSHEFRTPLNAILGFTQLMVRDTRMKPDQRENMAIIYRSSEHLLGLINDVLEISKIESGRTILAPSSFDLHRLLEGLEEMFALRAEGKGISLELALSPGVPQYVNADEGKLRQVLMNLLGNAVKFTQAGQVMLRVAPGSPSDDAQNQWIAFAVEDTGPGIPAEELEQLFVPFVQTTVGQEAQEGTGLGLSISQQYVHLMGGDIQVKTQPGEGSIFQFELPFRLVGAADLEKPQPTRRVIGLQPGQLVRRILVVDDQEVNRKLLAKIFIPLGFEVKEAENGKQALITWEYWQPHLILMDMRMPVMNGYEATRQIKATTQGQATIIIALTASALEEDRVVILSEGCDDYIRKPFHEDELLATVARYLGVQYIYQDIAPVEGEGAESRLDQPEAAAPAAAESLPDLAARLSHTDPEWLDQLQRATILGDQEALIQLAVQLETQDLALEEGLTRMISAYDHDRILRLIQQAQGRDEHDAG